MNDHECFQVCKTKERKWENVWIAKPCYVVIVVIYWTVTNIKDTVTSVLYCISHLILTIHPSFIDKETEA